MVAKLNLYKRVKKILKEVRFGILSNRISDEQSTEDIEFAKDFNNMLDALSDREKMIKEYQAIILSNNEYLKSLFNMMNEAAMTLSEDFKIITLNEAQANLFRKNKKKLIGKNLFDILKKYKIYDFETLNQVTDYVAFFKEEKDSCKLAFELRKIKVYLSISLKKFSDKDGNLNYFIVSNDITSDVNLQKLKDTFVATLTHDLKVPIIAESKVLNLLSNDDFANNHDFRKEALDNMVLNNNDMLSLVTTLLDVYKLENNSYNINLSSCDIEKIINEEVEKLKYILKENKCNIKVNLNAENTFVSADAKEISRVFKNLFTNAINFAPQNSDIIVDICSDNDYLVISVTDFGSGISKKDIHHVFDRYFTSDKKYRKVGTGLGLYLSQKIVKLHKGEILVNSISDKKTTFTVKLPKK